MNPRELGKSLMENIKLSPLTMARVVVDHLNNNIDNPLIVNFFLDNNKQLIDLRQKICLESREPC